MLKPLQGLTPNTSNRWKRIKDNIRTVKVKMSVFFMPLQCLNIQQCKISSRKHMSEKYCLCQ